MSAHGELSGLPNFKVTLLPGAVNKLTEEFISFSKGYEKAVGMYFSQAGIKPPPGPPNESGGASK